VGRIRAKSVHSMVFFFFFLFFSPRSEEPFTFVSVLYKPFLYMYLFYYLVYTHIANRGFLLDSN
jgi:hypothetical protein